MTYISLLALLAALVKLVYDLYQQYRNSKKAVYFRIEVPVADTMTVNQTIPINVQPIDAKGNPSTFVSGTVPAWSPVDPTVGTLTVAADGMSATLNPIVIGSVTITVTVSFSGGAVSHSVTVTVTAGVAVDFNLVLGTPSP